MKEGQEKEKKIKKGKVKKRIEGYEVGKIVMKMNEGYETGKKVIKMKDSYENERK